MTECPSHLTRMIFCVRFDLTIMEYSTSTMMDGRTHARALGFDPDLPISPFITLLFSLFFWLVVLRR
jgi:hypothetical protein